MRSAFVALLCCVLLLLRCSASSHAAPATEPVAQRVPDAGARAGQEAGIALLPDSHTDFPLTAAVEPARASSLARRVELLDAGREPRRALRHRFVRGRQKFTVRSVIRLQEQQSVVGELGIEAPLEVVLEPQTRADRAEFSYRLGPAKLAKRGDAAIRAAPDLGGLAEGTTLAGRGSLSDRGILTEHRFAPEADEAQTGLVFARSLAELIIELPEEPVGKGARWDVVLEAESSGIVLTQRTSHEIVELRGNRVKLRLKQSESVVLDGGSAPPGLAGAPTEGEWTVTLGQCYPTGRQRGEQPLLAGAAAGPSVSVELSIEMRAR